MLFLHQKYMSWSDVHQTMKKIVLYILTMHLIRFIDIYSSKILVHSLDRPINFFMHYSVILYQSCICFCVNQTAIRASTLGKIFKINFEYKILQNKSVPERFFLKMIWFFSPKNQYCDQIYFVEYCPMCLNASMNVCSTNIAKNGSHI